MKILNTAIAALFSAAAILFAVEPAVSQSFSGEVQPGYFYGNSSASAAKPSGQPGSAMFDRAFASTRGSILERTAMGWGVITPGAAGLPFVSNGAGADPAYQALTNAGLAQAPATTLKCNPTGSLASVQDCLLGQGLNFQSTTLQSERGFVHMWPNSGQSNSSTSPWKATDPYGAAINCAGTNTQCLQEAYNFADTNHWGLVVDCQAVTSTLTIGTTVTLAGSHNIAVYFRNCNIASNGSLGSADLFFVQGYENSVLDMGAIVSQSGADTGTVFRIGNAASPTTSSDVGYIHVNDIVPSASGVGVTFDTTNGSILGNRFFFDDINGGTYAVQCTGLSSHVMYGNHIYGMDWHGQTTGTTNCGPTVGGEHDNTWEVGVSRPINVTTAWDMFGVGDAIKTYVSTELGTITNGIKFETNSCANKVDSTFNNPTNFVVDTSNCNYRLHNATNAYTSISEFINGSATTTAANTQTLSNKTFPAGSGVGTFTPSGPTCKNVTVTQSPANTSENLLQTCTIPASALTANGNTIHITADGTYGANANNKTIKVYIANTITLGTTTPIYNSGVITQNGTTWHFEANIWRTGLNTQTWSGSGLQAGTSMVSASSGNLTNTEANAITVGISGQSGTGTLGDVTQLHLRLDQY